MNDLLIQQVAQPAPDTQLLLMFHGVGADPEGLLPLGQHMAQALPGAWVVSVRSPHPSDLGRGWQWFSVQGITEASRPARHRRGDAELPGDRPGLAAQVRRAPGANDPARLFSRREHGAGRHAGRRDAGQRIHLLHGDRDPVMPVSHSMNAAAQLQALSLAVSLDVFPDLAHAIDARVVERVTQILASP